MTASAFESLDLIQRFGLLAVSLSIQAVAASLDQCATTMLAGAPLWRVFTLVCRAETFHQAGAVRCFVRQNFLGILRLGVVVADRGRTVSVGVASDTMFARRCRAAGHETFTRKIHQRQPALPANA